MTDKKITELPEVTALTDDDVLVVVDGASVTKKITVGNAKTSIVADHLADTVDAHDASALSFTPTGTVAATTVQAAIAEVSGDVDTHISDTVDAHDASAISLADAGSYFDSGNAETALQEVGMYAAAMEMLQPQNQLPVLWLDAAHSVAGEQAAVNRGTGGSALNARYGSTTGADTNDPLLLTHDGENYAYLTGTVGYDYLLVPDAANLDITGDIEIQLDMAMDDWVPAGNVDIIQRWNTAPNEAWHIRVRTDGLLTFYWYPTGSDASLLAATSTVAPTVTDGERLRLKFTLDVDNGTGGHTVKFYTSPDGAMWTQLGADVTVAGVTALPAITASVIIMASLGGAVPNTKFFGCKILDGIGGTTVLDINCATDITDSDATSFTATTGQTVTVARSASGRKTALVTRPIWLFGTDDYMEIADNALLDFGATDSFTVLAVFRAFDTITSAVGILGKYSVGAPGYDLIFGTSNRLRATLRDGTLNSDTAASGPVLTPGQLSTVAMTRNVVADQWGVGVNASEFTMTDVTTGTAANSQPFTIGRREGFNYLNGEIVAVAVFRRALTADEIANICAYYGTV